MRNWIVSSFSRRPAMCPSGRWGREVSSQGATNMLWLNAGGACETPNPALGRSRKLPTKGDYTYPDAERTVTVRANLVTDCAKNQIADKAYALDVEAVGFEWEQGTNRRAR